MIKLKSVGERASPRSSCDFPGQRGVGRGQVVDADSASIGELVEAADVAYRRYRALLIDPATGCRTRQPWEEMSTDQRRAIIDLEAAEKALAERREDRRRAFVEVGWQVL